MSINKHPGNFKSGWHIVYTLPNNERKLGSELERKEIQYLIPVTTVEKKWHDRKKIVSQLLFPSYVFVKLNNVKDTHHVNSSNGFCYFLRDCGHLAILKEDLINNLLILNLNKQNLVLSKNHFIQGNEMIITTGILEGLKGEIIRYGGKERLLMRLNILNSNILFDLPVNTLMLSPFSIVNQNTHFLK